jgi:hypothetical protein
MTTKADKIAALKLEHPTLKSGGDDAGYVDLTPEEYEATIEAWADSILDKEAKATEAEATAQAKLDAIDKLIALGIDPKALGL